MKKILALISLLSMLGWQPVLAAESTDTAASTTQTREQPLLIAQTCTACGANLSAAVGVGSLGVNKQKHETLLTDSLWGNLILEMAYQRDKELSGIMRKMGLLNTGTLVSIGGIAAGTLAQGVTALTTLNPPDGRDSYLPGSLGIGFSCATIITFAARTYFGHQYQKHIHDRQLQLKEETEAVLSHIEHSNGTCPQARDQLRALIGDRASNEWLQMWHCSHQLASEKQPTISNLVPVQPDLSQMLSDAAQSQAHGLNLAEKANLFVMQQCNRSAGLPLRQPPDKTSEAIVAGTPAPVPALVSVPEEVH